MAKFDSREYYATHGTGVQRPLIVDGIFCVTLKGALGDTSTKGIIASAAKQLGKTVVRNMDDAKEAEHGIEAKPSKNAFSPEELAEFLLSVAIENGFQLPKKKEKAPKADEPAKDKDAA